LNPTHEYIHPVESKFRYSDLHPDLGAYELQQISANKEYPKHRMLAYYLSDSKQLILDNKGSDLTNKQINCTVFSLDGKPFSPKRQTGVLNTFDLAELIPGIYTFTLKVNTEQYAGTFVVTR